MGTNSELAEIFQAIADLLDLQGERFKPEAYRRAARSIESLTEDIRKVAGRGGLDEIPGVGEAIAEKIREFLSTGQIQYYERLKREVPPGLIEIMQLPGLGPKTARRFYLELQIEGPEELREAIRAGRLNGLKGFGPKKIEQIRTALDQAKPSGVRTPLSAAFLIAQELVRGLRAGPGVDQIEVAGSFRRRRETVGDLDLLVTSRSPEGVFETFTGLSGIERVVLRGPTKETVIWKTGIQIDLRVVEPESFGAALVYFTGSKDHNIHLRSLARDRGLKINEYGVFRGEDRVGGATEEDVYRTLELDWIPAEIREDRGEIDAAARHALPHLVTQQEVRGFWHEHLGEITEEAVEAVVRSTRLPAREFVGLTLAPDQVGQLEELRQIVSRFEASSRPGWPKLLIGLELSRSASTPTDRRPEGVGFLVEVPPSGESRPPTAEARNRPASPPLFAAHFSVASSKNGTAEDPRGAWIAWAKAVGAALEVAPAYPQPGLDSLGVQQAIAQGVPVVLRRAPYSVEEGGLELAVGTARRGWAVPENVLESRPLAGARPSSGSGSRTHKKAL